MKKLYTLSFTLLAAALSFAQAGDSFIGTGALNANGWTTHSGTAGQMMITPGSSLSYTGMVTNGNKAGIIAGNSEDVNLASGDLTGSIYYSLLLNLPNTTGLNTNTSIGDYPFMVASTAGTSVTSFFGRIYIKAGLTADTFNLGVLNASGGTVAPTYITTDFAINTTYFVVVKYDITSHTASLWVNPAIGGSETTANITNSSGTTTAPTVIKSIAVRQNGNTTAGTGNIEFDEVRIGSTWSYVTSANLKTNNNSISGLRVYPNPVVDGTLYIDTDNNVERTVAIYDVLGKQVVKATTSNSAINVNNLKNGVYLVKITEEGKTATRKLVIK